jgi:hypothetical protein
VWCVNPTSSISWRENRGRDPLLDS